MSDDWRLYRPAIWLAMLGLAVILVLNPYAGALMIGGAIGVAARILRGRRRLARGSRSGPGRGSRRRRRRR